MKKTKIIIFCLLSLLILTIAGNAAGYNGSFTHTDYSSSASPTLDGQYTDSTEWSASGSKTFGLNGLFRDEWVSGTPTYEYLLIETSDNTSDSGDYWEICYDSSNASISQTPPNNGTAPEWDDTRIVITGHGGSQTLTWYQGNGVAWVVNSSQPASSVFSFSESLATWGSVSSSPHYILELRINKQDTSMGTNILGYNFAIRVAYNDARPGGNGLQAWPPSPASANNPNSWGYVTYSSSANSTPDPTPESLSIVAVLSLSSVAVIAGVVLLHKRQKITRISPTVAVP
jgi:hypothetical protein